MSGEEAKLLLLVKRLAMEAWDEPAMRAHEPQRRDFESAVDSRLARAAEEGDLTT